jgi:hypothetical protein
MKEIEMVGGIFDGAKVRLRVWEEWKDGDLYWTPHPSGTGWNVYRYDGKTHKLRFFGYRERADA